MPNKEFLEKYPLHKKFNLKNSGVNKYTRLHSIPKPAINIDCKVCASSQTFNMVNEYGELDYSSDSQIPRKVLRAKYLCSGCREQLQIFYCFFSIKEEIEEEDGEDITTESIMVNKIGQIPTWEIEIDKELEKVLGDHSYFYKRGIICESQGFGIGAFAYYRRIIEEIIDELLISIEDLITDEEQRNIYEKALEKVKKTRVTQEKIDLVKDLLPSTLRPNNMNPLGVLHSSLSEGLHAEDEDECMEYASAIRESLIFLVNRLLKIKEDDLAFSENMKKILNKKIS